ncbi:MAG: hypothetical protein FD168_551 [Desulfobulbaceae bacterium]|nr:MAG: hypothetical protein FD168_551 [Desulfobulbaceae bacterium]
MRELKEHFCKSVMKSGEVFFTLAADKSNGPKDLGVIFSGGKAAIWILNIMGCNNYILSNFNKIFIVSTRGTGEQVHGRTIFYGHNVYTIVGIVGGWGACATQRLAGEFSCF